MPVIEGACKRTAEHWGVSLKTTTNNKPLKAIISELIFECKKYIQKNNIGAKEEILCMLDSFREYSESNLYINSKNYPHTDNTNRHGILHGDYNDNNYGSPINFYKTIAAIDFLCFISSFKHPISFFAPAPTEQSQKLSEHYSECLKIAILRSKKTFKLLEDPRFLSFAQDLRSKK